MEKDLTKGPILKTLLLFALPMMLGNLLQQIYNITDTIIVGRVLGSGALAAVGSTYTLMTFLTSVMIGLCMGCGALFSMHYGAGHQNKMKECMWISFWLILLVIGGFLGADLYLTSSTKGSVGMALRAIFAALELLVLAVGIYAFGLTARYENSIKGTIRNALTLTLARFPSSILMVAIMIALIGISIWNLQLITFALPFWALFGVSIIFWINSKLLRRIFAGIEDHTEEEVEE